MTRRDVVRAIAAVSATAICGGNALTAGGGTHIDAGRFHSMRRMVGLGGRNIAVARHGEGPSALLIHGWPLNGFHWRKVLPGLAHARTCIVPDLMGLGYSEVPAGQDLSHAAQAAMLADLLDALGVGQVDIIANDSGTAIAQLLALDQPDRIRSMLLTNGDVHTNSPPEALLPALEAARAGVLDEMFELHLTDAAFASSPMGLGSICYEDPASLTREAIEVYFRPLLASPRRRSQAQQYGVAFEPNPLPAIEARLRALRVPVRMVWGTGDIHFGIAWAHWLDEALPASRGVRVVEGAKLFFPEEHADVIVAEALDLWAGTIAQNRA